MRKSISYDQLMQKLNRKLLIEFTSCKRRKVQADFGGGEITSDAGVMLLSEADKKLKLTERIAPNLYDPRCPGKCDHSMLDLLRQRVYAIALGYEDLNDHDTLRKDTALQTAVGRDSTLGSRSTLCRFENWVKPDALWHISASLVDVFIESFKKPPKKLILDFDCTDDPVHGHQVGRFFHGYYDCHCFLPLYVFCGKHLLAAYLRPEQHRSGQRRLGYFEVAGHALSSAMARCAHRVSCRQWILPPPYVQLV